MTRLLQVLPSVVSHRNGYLEVEDDFCEGLRLCLENFDEVRFCCPVTEIDSNSGLQRGRRLDDLPKQHLIKFIPLPNAYKLKSFLFCYPEVRAILDREIQKSDYLVFSPHSLIGDWPTVAVREAIRQNRPYVIDSDTVYERVGEAYNSHKALWKRLIKAKILTPIFSTSHQHALRNSCLALLQGQDVYNTYARHCSNAHKVYHMPVSRSDYITEADLQEKISSLNEPRPLRICYAGRAIGLKGPHDWLQALTQIKDSNIRVEATWLGTGDLLFEMGQIVSQRGLNVHLAGYISNRTDVLKAMREADIFLFCHKVPESPRCLVEALASGCPIVGYSSLYARDIVSERGGGAFVETNDWRGLAQLVMDLSNNRRVLQKLIKDAAASGRLYERDATMQKRIDLIKEAVPLAY